MEKDYILNISSEQSNTLSGKHLRSAKFAFDSPFQLQLIDDQVFFAEKILRFIPGRRLVAYGNWSGQSVVAKLFFHTDAKRHLKKELAGIKALTDNKIPTPKLYYQTMSADKRVHVLLFQRLFEAKNLEELWQNRESVNKVMPQLRGMIYELATHHVLGVLQHDLHLKNFLFTKKKIYTLDGAGIERLQPLLSRKLSMKNLALFFSQLGVTTRRYQEKLFHYYAKARGWVLKKRDFDLLFLEIKKYNEQRWRRFEKKIFRECTSFAPIRRWLLFGMFDRHYNGPEFAEFLKNPEFAFLHPTATVLKDGRSATVIKVIFDDRELVVKRYNMKNFWHKLRRCLRKTRAFTSWRLAHKLSLFGVLTAKPVAFVESRCFGFRGTSYYVTEYISGEHAGHFFAHNKQEEIMTEMIKSITTLLKDLAKLEITHGDLKITNILIDHLNRPVLIDLDGAAEHRSASGLRSAWRKEIKRFLENFQEQPWLQEQFSEELGK